MEAEDLSFPLDNANAVDVEAGNADMEEVEVGATPGTPTPVLATPLVDDEVSTSASSNISSPSEGHSPKRRMTIEEPDNDGGKVSEEASKPAPPPQPQVIPPVEEVTEYESYVLEVEAATKRLMSYIVSKTKVVESVEEGRALISEMMEKGKPLAVDCEGVNLGDRMKGMVTQIQFATWEGQVLVFDLVKEPGLAQELKCVLESEDIVKVIHDCLADSRGLEHFGIKLNNVFDTQVAHKLVHRRTKAPSDKEESTVGLERICKMYGGQAGPFKDVVKGVYRKNQEYWTHRPLTEIMICYAASDVLSLVPNVYSTLNTLLGSSGEERELFDKMCAERCVPPVENGGSGGGGRGRERYRKNRRGGPPKGYNNQNQRQGQQEGDYYPRRQYWNSNHQNNNNSSTYQENGGYHYQGGGYHAPRGRGGRGGYYQNNNNYYNNGNGSNL